MRIKYNVTIDDLVAFNLFYQEHSAIGRRNRLISGLILPIGIFVLLSFLGVVQGNWTTPIVAAIAAGLLAIWVRCGWRKGIEKIVRKMLAEGSNKSILGPHELELTMYGLTDRNEYGEEKFSWGGVERLGFTPDYTFIFTGATSAIPIKGSSVIKGDYLEFVDFLKRSFEEHKKAQPEEAGQVEDVSSKFICDNKKIYEPDAGFGKHSGHGIASLAIAIILGGLYVMLFLSFFILGFFAPATAESPSVLLMVVGSIFMLGFFGNLVGLGLGIAGVCQKNRKKTLAVLGIVFNSVALFLFTILILIGSTR